MNKYKSILKTVVLQGGTEQFNGHIKESSSVLLRLRGGWSQSPCPGASIGPGADAGDGWSFLESSAASEASVPPSLSPGSPVSRQ